MPGTVTECMSTTVFNHRGGTSALVAVESVRFGSVTITECEVALSASDAANVHSLYLDPQPQHLSPGQCLHRCLDEGLAQLILGDALYALVQHFDALALAVERSVPCLRAGSVVRALGALSLQVFRAEAAAMPSAVSTAYSGADGAGSGRLWL
jgi:hypothetical protein